MGSASLRLLPSSIFLGKLQDRVALSLPPVLCPGLLATAPGLTYAMLMYSILGVGRVEAGEKSE